MIACFNCKRLVTKEHSFLLWWPTVHDAADLFRENYCRTCKRGFDTPFPEAKRQLDERLALEQQARDNEQARIEQLYRDYPIWAETILSLEELSRQNREIRGMCRRFAGHVDALPWP